MRRKIRDSRADRLVHSIAIYADAYLYNIFECGGEASIWNLQYMQARYKPALSLVCRFPHQLHSIATNKFTHMLGDTAIHKHMDRYFVRVSDKE